MLLREAIARVWAFANKRRLERHFDEELAAHIELATQHHVDRGVPPTEARRLALVQLGGVERTRQLHRESRSIPWLEALLQDSRYAARALIRSRGFSATAVATLTIAIGLNVAVFTVANAALFKGFRHVKGNERILYVGTQRNGSGCCVSYPDFEDWRVRSQSFEDLAAVADLRVAFTDASGFAESYTATLVTTNTFRLLHKSPVQGRDFSPDDAVPGAPPVTILSYGFWKRRYQQDPSVIGRTVRVSGTPTTIIGVMPEGFAFPQNQDLWLPLTPTRDLQRRDARTLWFAFGRLADGVTFESARTELATIGQQLAAEHPQTNDGWVPAPRTFAEFFVAANASTTYLGIWAAVGFVLLIACANLGNLMLARALDRAQEMSLHVALGATRLRIVRQLLLESFVLSALGGMAGVAFAGAALRVYERFANPPTLTWSHGLLDYSFDTRVLAYVCAAVIVAALVFGLAPALRLVSLDVNGTLKDGARGASRGRRQLSGTLVIAELALAVVLLAGAGAMVRSFERVRHADLGITPEGNVTFLLQLPGVTYPSTEARAALLQRLESGLAGIPGVEAVTTATSLPTGGVPRRAMLLDGSGPVDPHARPLVSTLTIGSDYFRVLGARLIAGRDFAAADGPRSLPVAIVNQRFASTYFESGDPLGRQIHLSDGDTDRVATVVGLVSNIAQNDSNRSRQEFDPLIYLPVRQAPPQATWVIVRTQLPIATVAMSIRAEMERLDPELPIWIGPFPLTARLAGSGGYWQLGTHALLLSLSAAIAISLAALGVFALVSQSVRQRTQEIGIRVALGGTAQQIVRLVCRQIGWQSLVGLGLGLFGAAGVLPLLRSSVVGVSPTDPATLAATSTLLLMVAALACVIPVRRALRVDPVDALRSR